MSFYPGRLNEMGVNQVNTVYSFDFVQVYTGAYRKQSQTDVREVQDLAGIKIDQLLAVRSCPNSNIKPWVAQVRSISDSDVWMDGRYTSKWRVARLMETSYNTITVYNITMQRRFHKQTENYLTNKILSFDPAKEKTF